MNIAELQIKQGNVELAAVEITDKSPVREFSKFGSPGRVCNATIKDDTGSVQLTLWNEQVDQFDVGDKLSLKDCFVNEWQGEKQLTTGRNGTIEKV